MDLESDLNLHGSESEYGYELNLDLNLNMDMNLSMIRISLSLSLSLSLPLSRPGTPRNEASPAGGRKVAQARTKSLSNESESNKHEQHIFKQTI